MRKGAKLTYFWKVEGGTFNHDIPWRWTGRQPDVVLEGPRRARGRGRTNSAFDGNHGWFLRNRGFAPVTVKLTAWGDFGSLKQVADRRLPQLPK